MLTSVRTRIRARHECVTEDEVRGLKSTVKIVNEELFSNNEACGVASNGIGVLRDEILSLKSNREQLQEVLDLAREELNEVTDKCAGEHESRLKAVSDVARMRHGIEEGGRELLNLRSEVESKQYFQDTVDTETNFRLMADVQNLIIEKDQESIRLRQLATIKSNLQSQMETFRKEKDALQYLADDTKRQVSEEQMTLKMYVAHRESLTMHLDTLGGSLVDQMSGWFRRSKNTSAESDNLDGVEKSTDKSTKQTKRRETDSKAVSSSKSKSQIHQRTKAVGGVVQTSNSRGGSKGDLLNKLPSFFKIGHPRSLAEYVASEEREIEFNADSLSETSSVTIDWDGFTANITEEQSHCGSRRGSVTSKTAVRAGG
ncbi:hypothetical protein THAOC_06011 [Thalassiosira oceanica]|uniref:Uncharacterized protein n=1 Tax=Thalassiosira oceanica TaxID=159749 RepID=K0T5P3_THAOC|nr:hypothetical protein THAOC_06011 [Thalassiosira oceanica]|eukprot:EJK72459.1 hypothetical protein THAOC_06011 [Thalassiosira oceanica]